MTEAVASIQGRKLAARYTLLEKLGAGGQGEVWRAHDGTRGVDIALKVLNPAQVRDEDAWQALEHEYAIASLLDHPAILKVYPPDRSGDVIVLPMELASGGDLRRLRGAGFLEIIPVLLEIAQALEHAHDRGVVHRDLKPGNVLFDARGRARLADFGVAEAAVMSRTAEDAIAPGATRDTNRQGLSPFTASPAQLRGEPPKPADDIYGLGALAYELLSGYPPYYPHFDRKRAIEEPVPELVPTRQIPPLLGALVTRMLAKNPAERPASMREVIDELDAALNSTLTYDFDSIAESLRAVAAQPDSPSETSGPGRDGPGGLDLSVLLRSAGPAANMPEGPPRVPDWSPDSGADRRAAPDRRAARRTSFLPAPEVRTPPAGAQQPAASRSAASHSNERRAAGHVVGEGSPARQAARDGSPARQAAREAPPARHVPASSRNRPAADAGREAPVNLKAGPQRQTAPPPPRTTESSGAIEPYRTAEPPRAAEPVRKMEPPRATPQPWRAIPLDGLPRLPRLEPIRQRRWPWVLLGLIAGGAAAVYFWLPQVDPQAMPPDVSALIAPLQAVISPASSRAKPAARDDSAQAAAPSPATAAAANAPVDSSNTASPGGSLAAAPAAASNTSGGSESRFRALRQNFESRLEMLQSRGAGVWGGRDFSLAKTRAAEAVEVHDAGNLRAAHEKMMSASQLLDSVETKAPQALIAQIAAGEKALGTGQQEVAGQAFDLARRIDPNDRRASDGQRRAQSLGGVLPLLADAQNAESAHDYARAAQDYSQALSLDPGNATAKAGQARSNAAFGDDNYAKAVGSGFAALGAGRLDESHDDFVKARALKPNGSEAAEGLRRVSAALTARGFGSMRQRAAGLEAQERWQEAEQAYTDILKADPSLAFAQEGRARASSRAELSDRLQQFIDNPDRLASPAAREEARSLVQTADAQSPSGPVLRSQVARLQILMPGDDKPVRLSLLSDNSTQVAISSIGSFGTFARREIQLRPGRYTVVGTRTGFREVRREITVSPGQDTQTIRVSCSEPI
ncbi:MAG TPA: protein kinase [Steroidobacteraceae bacterium]|jgi:serine/threonine protein kinase/tetratricopeptide (TPR) repeat protein